MSYISIPITASGGTVDNYLGFSTYANVLFFTASPVTLTTSLALTPSVAQAGATFNVRWNADVTLDTFAVTICGFTISQDQVNQKGNFSCYYDGSAWTVFYNADGSDQPQIAQGVAVVTVPVSGALTLEAGVDRVYQRLVGSPTTLSGNYVVTASTSGIKEGSQFQIEIAGGVTLDGNTMTIFGISINTAQALNGGGLVTATFDGSVWRGVSSSASDISDLADIDPVSVVCNPLPSTPQAPTTLDAQNDGEVLFRTGGALVFSKLNSENIASGNLLPFYSSTSVPNASILTLFTTPYTLTSSSLPTGSMNIPSAFIVEVVYGSAAFATENTLQIRHIGSSVALYQQVGGLATTSSNFFLFTPVSATVTTTQLLKNVGFELYCPTNNPTVGTGTTIKIHAFYLQQILS
jgi:hypothetical protein